MNVIQSFVAIAILAVVPIADVIADRPAGDIAMPLVDIIERLEQEGYGPVTEASFDDGHWEIETFKSGKAYELTVDGRNGKVLSEHRDNAKPRPPRDAQLLSQILHRLDKAGYTNIDDVSFERNYWEVEAHREDGKYELHVHTVTGEIIRERRDD